LYPLSESCTVTADGESLGTPECKATQNIYLKSVYACVKKDVLLPKYRGEEETTTTTTTTATTSTKTSTTTDSGGVSPKQETIMLGDPSMIDEEDNRSSPSSTKQERTASRSNSGNVVGNGFGDENVSTTTESDLVVGFVSDFMSSYAHIKNHKEKFILFATLSVALGLTLFLSMVVWGMYRSSRLSRIKASMQRPPSSSYFAASPTSSANPQTPDGTVDIELEVCDHEVDTAFREPAPEARFIAPMRTTSSPPMHQVPPLQQQHQPLLYGSLRRPRQYHNRCNSGGYLVEGCYCDQPPYPGAPVHAMVHDDVMTLSASAMVNAPPHNSMAGGPLLPPGILRNSATRESPASSIVHSPSMSSTASGAMIPHHNGKVVRYSTIGRPRVSSPPSGSRSPLVEQDDTDLADPRSLTLSRLTTSDHLLYG
jgi:hypothetical protein